MSLPPYLRPFVEAYRGALAPATRFAALSCWVALSVAGVHWARGGTTVDRAVGIGLCLAGLTLWGFRWLLMRRVGRTKAGAVRATIVAAQPDVGHRVLRALRLMDEAETHPGESTELVQLHFERMLAMANLKKVGELAQTRGRHYSRVGLVALGAACLGTFFAPVRAQEGLSILLARDGVGRFEMKWLRNPVVDASPPAYLRQKDSSLMLDSAASLPDGTRLSFRGKPLRQGRQLVLSDGETEVPFVDDGSGAVVAHWELGESVHLRVGARFGDTLIYEPREVALHSQRDLAPQVDLKGAPASHQLAKLERLALQWSARDDHSLVQVDLVLRSAGRQERRLLERYPGDKNHGAGGYVLQASDPFLRRIFLPAEVTIEARDNDSIHGDKWGKSAPMVIRPPVVGAPEVERLTALRAMRDGWVRFLAQRRGIEGLPREKKRPARAALLKAMKSVVLASETALGGAYGGLSLSDGWRHFATAQFEKVERAHQTGKHELAVTEQVVLGLDRGLRSLATGDARKIAKLLGDVAEEAALAARLAQSQEKPDSSLRRLDLALSVLEQGSVKLRALGLLGRDVGSVAATDLARVVRARKDSDLFHAELAALHMAARLHRPNPSFGSKGGGGGGVEGGPGMGGGGGQDASGESSDADSEFNQVAQDLQQLAQEHAGAVEQTGAAMQSAAESVTKEDLQEEARRRAERLRWSVVRLPPPGAPPGTGRSAAALLREQVGTMAHELERLALDEALESGRRAKAAAQQALRASDLAGGLQQRVTKAQRLLLEQLSWLLEQSERVRQQTESAAHQSLREVAGWEGDLAERASRLSSAPETAESLPKEILERLKKAQEMMQDAARRLELGQGEAGLMLQREAQRLLEQSETGQTGEEEEQESGAPDGKRGGKQQSGTEGDVPDAPKENGAQDFRRRVLRGLGQSEGGGLERAVQRYAEGLLR